MNRIVATRLVAPVALAGYCAQRASIGEGVSAVDVAVEFDVPEWIAVISLRELGRSAA